MQKDFIQSHAELIKQMKQKRNITEIIMMKLKQNILKRNAKKKLF